MFDAIERFPFKRTLFALFVLFVFSTSIFEIASEFAAGETEAQMSDDLARFVFSSVMLGIFVYDRVVHSHTIGELRRQLDKARGQLARLDAHSQNVARQYRGVLQKQFDAWRLSASEQEVVIGMLKGLSFREIAALRETREKTVRQQASSVYRKAGVAGRNELVAWFFEDMLEVRPDAIE